MNTANEDQHPGPEVSQHMILCFEDVFSADECDRILELAGELEAAGVLEAGQIGGEGGDKVVRDVAVTFVMPDERSAWIFQRLGEVVAQANSDAYGADLEGFAQGFQLSCYEPGQHYGWHVDMGVGGSASRKLSVTLQLSEPDDYAGGDLEFWVPELNANRARGSMTVFPSWTVHRVSPVTRGRRWSLVSWISGPRWR
jgi:PKHD-type hydroxylase